MTTRTITVEALAARRRCWRHVWMLEAPRHEWMSCLYCQKRKKVPE